MDDLKCSITDDKDKVIRSVVSSAINSKVVLVGQALGASTQRLSGLPYTKTNLGLSNSGRNLEKFLNLFGYTINSMNTSLGYQYAYSSDIVQCYPGRKESGKGDREPNSAEIFNCFRQQFLTTEIKLIKPKLILLMGKASRDSFYEHILRIDYPSSLTEHIEDIVDKRHLSTFEGIALIPIQHPSGRNLKFQQMFMNKKLVNLIEEALDD